MKIRKTFQAAVPSGKVIDSYATSTTDTYSCNYVNELFAVLTGSIEVPAATSSHLGTATIEVPYPQGFTQSNTAIISPMIDFNQTGAFLSGLEFGVPSNSSSYTSGFVSSTWQPQVQLLPNTISIKAHNYVIANGKTYGYKIVLMKIPE